MKIKDYQDAIEFFRTNDYQAADGAWSEFYQSEVLEPRITDLADGGRIPFSKGGDFETWLKNQPEGTEFRTVQELFEKAGVKSHGANQKIWNKYKDKFKITSGSRLGGDITLKNEKILEFFNKQEPGSKINVEQAVKIINKNLPKDQQISETIITNRLKDTKFNTRALGSQTLGQYHGELSDIAKAHIEEAYGDIIDFKKGKYGVSAGGRGESKALYESIRRFVNDGVFNRAYSLGAADGWILESFKRAGYKPIKQVMPKSKMEKIIGFETPDGTKWFSAKTNATKYNGKHITTAHPGYERVNKLVNIVKETRVAPNDAIIDMLKKGSGVKNIDGITLESLTNYLLDNDVDIKDIKKGLSTYHKHHVKGVKISPDADIQLVTRVANTEARKVMNEIELLKKNNQPIDYDALDNRLKNYGVSVEVDGKRLGGSGFESKADIEKFVTKKIGDWKTADFEKFAKQFIKNDVKFASFPANIGAMWRAMGSGGRKALGLSTGLLTELIFMGLDMKNEMSKGKSTEEAASIAKRNASFGVYNDGTYLKELKRVAEDMDIDTQAFDKAFAMNERMFKVGQQQDYYQAKIDKLKTMGPQGIEEAAKMQQAYDEWQSGIDAENEKLIEGIAGQVAISKAGKVFPNPNLDQIAKARYTLTSDEFGEVFEGLKKAGIEKLKREKTKAFDVQSKQADPEAGSTFNWLTNFFTGSENFLDWRTKGQEEQRLIDDMLEFSPQELYRYNLQRGVDPDSPITQESFENLVYDQPGLGFYSGGGIASLKKKW
jgi:DNA-binding transcriptional MerR regulator